MHEVFARVRRECRRRSALGRRSGRFCASQRHALTDSWRHPITEAGTFGGGGRLYGELALSDQVNRFQGKKGSVRRDLFQSVGASLLLRQQKKPLPSGFFSSI